MATAGCNQDPSTSSCKGPVCTLQKFGVAGGMGGAVVCHTPPSSMSLFFGDRVACKPRLCVVTNDLKLEISASLRAGLQVWAAMCLSLLIFKAWL